MLFFVLFQRVVHEPLREKNVRPLKGRFYLAFDFAVQDYYNRVTSINDGMSLVFLVYDVLDGYYQVLDGTLEPRFRKNLNASKPSEHPPQVEECLKV